MTPEKQSQVNPVRTPMGRATELLPLVLILAVALVFRLWQLEQIPNGLHHDEAIDLLQGLRVRDGNWFIFTTEGWGREALFYYPLALFLQLIPSNVLALRATVVVISLGVILVSYLLARRIAGPAGAVAGWLTAAWFAVNYWTLFTSRFGVRHLLLPLLLGLTVLATWRAWEAPPTARRRRFLLAGVLLGLTAYTYQPARFVIPLLVLFALYLLLFHRRALRQILNSEATANGSLYEQNGALIRRPEPVEGSLVHMGQNAPPHKLGPLVLAGATALLIALPLLIILVQNQIEFTSRAWTIEPLLQLRAGNPRPILDNLVAVLGMFTVRGDPLVAYNVPGRPVFQPGWTGIPFYVGFLIALWRWRRPAYAFLLIWLATMLLPTVVTIDTPSYNRAVGAQFPIMFLSALSLAELVRWADRRWPRTGKVAALAVSLAILTVTGVNTWRDYFQVWPVQKELAILYHSHATAISSYLQQTADAGPAIASGPDFENIDPLIVRVTLDRPEFELRWADPAQALPLPAGHDQARLILAADRWVDSTLSDYVNLSGQPIYAEDQFAVYQVSYGDWRDGSDWPLRSLAAGAPWPGTPATAGTAVDVPVDFADKVQLNSVESVVKGADADNVLTIVTAWRVLDVAEAIPLAVFAHLLDADGNLLGQSDGLGYPPHTWQPGDRFLQVHHITYDPSLQPGEYWLQFGLYRRDNGQRWPVTDDGVTVGDRLLMGPVSIR